MEHNSALRKRIESDLGYPIPDDDWERYAKVRNAVLDEIVKRVGDPWSLERGEWDRIIEEMRSK